MDAYCMKCKSKNEVVEPKEVIKITKTGERAFLQGKCSKCDTKVSKILGKPSLPSFEVEE